ncbi:MAG: hypothetical protein P8I55_16195 [Crocinitomix sp.]|nr:hypothetical protein [Crocinitomix sp.]
MSKGGGKIAQASTMLTGLSDDSNISLKVGPVLKPLNFEFINCASLISKFNSMVWETVAKGKEKNAIIPTINGMFFFM